MKAVIGLGNPGTKYRNTRHNLGFMVADELAQRKGLSFRKGKGQYLMAHSINDALFIIKPTTYMNLSGNAVREFMAYYNLSHKDLLVVLDDLDIDFGRVRFRPSGSAAGHKGMKSIIAQLHTDAIDRLRLGIQTEWRRNIPTEDYVLTGFSKEEQTTAAEMVQNAADAVEFYLENSIESTMNRYNQRPESKPNNQEKEGTNE